MHPYGGSPRCPRCEKAVYAAEQAMGPGRRLYHKACLTCADCGKRLDSFSLVEHDEEPYCKNCHRKDFGTRDLRQANLPHLPELSPTRTGSTFPPPSPTRTGTIINDHNSPFSFARAPAPAALLRPTRALSPTRTTFAPIGNFDAVAEGDEVGAKDKEVDPDAEEDLKEEEEVADVLRFPPGTPSAAGTHASGLPRSGQISPTRPQARLPMKTIPAPPFEEEDGDAVGDMKSAAAATFGPSPALPPRPTPMVTMTVGRHTGAPLMQTPTGSRYGTSTTPLRATPTGTNRWGGSTPQCPACSKSVYFAEQVKAVGKTWHKACLRCTQCGTSLDASKVTEKDGVPHCHRCYNKLHGPAGQGYALLGKAGG